MDRSGRTPAVLWIAFAAGLFLAACDSSNLPDSAELEAELRANPDRGGRVGQLVGLGVAQNAHRIASAISAAPDPRCAAPIEPGVRWIGELTIERRRANTVVSRWTETRTVDRDPGNVAMHYAASFRTELGLEATRAAQWRIVGSDSYLGTTTDHGEMWTRRATEEGELQRVVAHAGGMLQSLLDATDGWQRAGERWTLGDSRLRCGPTEPGGRFVDRFAAAATATAGELSVDDGVRTFRANWQLTDGSNVAVDYSDRIVELPEPVAAPEGEEIVATDRDRSLYLAQRLFEELAEAGLATVASGSDTPENPRKSDEAKHR